ILYSMLMAVVAVLSMSSCSDFLEATNKSNISADSYFTTEEGLEALRIKAYNEFKALVTNTDMMEWGTDLYDESRGKEPGEFATFSMTPESSDVQDFYSNAYSLINYANCCIKYGEKNAQITAEGIFMRCYGYYLLTQQFGAVPYVTWYIEDASRDYPRTPLNEIYPALIEDLEGIMNDSSLPANSIETYGHSGYISQRAVKALLARICLAAGWDLQTTLTDAMGSTDGKTYNVTSTEYFTKAAQYAVAAINGQSLTMSFEDKWSPSNQDNAEEIFSIQYDRAGYPGDVTSGGHSLQNSYAGYYGTQTSTGLKYTNSELIESSKSIYLWGEGDERWDGSFMNTIYNYNGDWDNSGYYAYYNVSDADKSKLSIAIRFFPYYVTEDEAEAEFAANISQYTKGANDVNNIYAFILASTTTKYVFNADGTYTKTTDTYDNINDDLNCPNALKKYDDPETTIGATSKNDYRDIVVFHLSEMYLVAAEAYLMANDAESARKYVNYVRARAGAEELTSMDPSYYESNFVFYSTPANFTFTQLDIILDESARELYGERMRWMDLRRTRQLVRYNVAFSPFISSSSDMSDIYGNVKWYRPIPSTEINGNDSMTDADQNPGY
ncbi:MAG: RagB/SusD family nutrient uptake outer membrane protein, partial [Prevotella sp.]|nr:RagB/SusD family nutrient uptake outer membrane protein [Prevotella sp.]